MLPTLQTETDYMVVYHLQCYAVAVQIVVRVLIFMWQLCELHNLDKGISQFTHAEYYMWHFFT